MIRFALALCLLLPIAIPSAIASNPPAGWVIGDGSPYDEAYHARADAQETKATADIRLDYVWALWQAGALDYEEYNILIWSDGMFSTACTVMDDADAKWAGESWEHARSLYASATSTFLIVIDDLAVF